MRSKRIHLAALALVLAPAARASNTGFTVDVALAGAGAGCLENLVSTPYFYFPSGSIGAPQSARDLSADFPTATRFSRIDPDTGILESWSLGGSGWSGTDFPLEAGLGIAISVPLDARERIVGSHDDSFPGRWLRAVGGPTRHLIAPPYHTTWSSADDLLDALFDGVNRLSVATLRGGRLLERSLEPGPVRSGSNFDLVFQEALLLTVAADTLLVAPHYFREGGSELSAPVGPAPGSGRVRGPAPGVPCFRTLARTPVLGPDAGTAAGPQVGHVEP